MSISEDKIKQLKEMVKSVRRNLLKAIYEGKMGHPGGSLSATDILVYLYFSKLQIFPEDPNRKDRDIFILSKGHAASALYAVLALSLIHISEPTRQKLSRMPSSA